MSTKRQDAIDAIGVAMQRYQRSVQSFDDAVGRALALGPADLRCLDCLSERAHTAGELAVATGLRPAATTALVDRLSERGLVQRRPSPEDRRRVIVELTPLGREQVWRAYGPLVEEGHGVFAGAPTERIQQMAELLDHMTSLTERHRARVEAGSATD
jgi:DNA-binding MarR family transcriptional regulator